MEPLMIALAALRNIADGKIGAAPLLQKHAREAIAEIEALSVTEKRSTPVAYVPGRGERAKPRKWDAEG